jgi:hypothetical protein
LLHRNGLADAGAKQEQAHNRAALQSPDRVGVKIRLEIPKMLQIKAKMESRHPDHGQTSKRVNGIKAGMAVVCHAMHIN